VLDRILVSAAGPGSAAGELIAAASPYAASMRAAVYYETGPPEVFRYEEVPDPVLHSRGVIVEVEAISIEGGDTLHRLGGEMSATPHIVGYQCAGTIREVGADVDDREVGQRVVLTVPHGSHAELVGVAARSTWLVPDDLDIVPASCVPIAFGTADDCLFEFGRLVAGETVLVQAGAGGVGIAAIQLAKRAGATVLATASSDDKLERLERLGLDHGINYATSDFVAETRRLTDGRGVDLVVDSVGSTLRGSIEALGYRGRISYVGDAGRDKIPADVGALRAQNQSITGVFLGAELAHGSRAYDNIARLLGEVASGELEVVVDRTFPLAEAADAHAYMEQRLAFGRVVLVP
jgi:NADPH:quinone reductase